MRLSSALQIHRARAKYLRILQELFWFSKSLFWALQSIIKLGIEERSKKVLIKLLIEGAIKLVSSDN